MFNKRIDELKASIAWARTEEGREVLGSSTDVWNHIDACEEQLAQLYELGWYGSEEAHHIIGVVD